jgi:hypothetical protein
MFVHAGADKRARSVSPSRARSSVPFATATRAPYVSRCFVDLPHVGMAILPAGSDIRRISDPSGTGSGTKFDPWVLPVPDSILLRVGYGFDFLPAGTRRISENSDFRFSIYQYAS